MAYNILLTGVGGQGTVLASKLIAAASVAKGLPVMSAETIGMAQKGGSVFSHLRVGAGAMSPMIRRGEADLLLAFEPAEAVRMMPYLKADGVLIANRSPVMPVTAALRGTDYTGREMVAYLKAHVKRLCVLDGEAAVRTVGNPKALNVIMLGAALEAGALPFLAADDVLAAIRARVRPQYAALNARALCYVRAHAGAMESMWETGHPAMSPKK